MTKQSSFKRLVRARMEKTGERYAAARAELLAADQSKPSNGPTLDAAKSTVAIEHERIEDAKEAERTKAYWREALLRLKERLEAEA